MHESIASPGAGQDIADAEPVIVRRIVSEFVRRGMAPESLLRGLGFSCDDLESVELRISYAQVRTVIRRALPLLGDPQLGLHLGASVNLVSWGFCFLGLMASAKSRAVLEFAVDFLPSTGRFLRLHGLENALEFSVVADARFDDSDVYAFLVDATFASLMQVCRKVVDPSFGPLTVDFMAPQPNALATYEDVFRCPLRFARPSNRMNFSLRSLPVATADSLVAKRSHDFMVLQQSGAAAVSSLEAAIIRSVRDDPRASPPLRNVAASLQMSERTFRRRLAEEGLAFSAVADRERMRRTLQLLRSGSLPLSAVATMTGFADARSLRRATTRWSGQTPTRIRTGTP